MTDDKLDMLEDVATWDKKDPKKGILSGFSITTYIYLAVGVAIVGIGLYAGFEHLKVKEAQAQVAALNLANQIQQQTITVLQKANIAAQQVDADVNAVEQSGSQELVVLVQKLQNLNQDAIAHPDLVQAKINAASDARIRCIALATGASLNKKETNKVCPQIIERLKNAK